MEEALPSLVRTCAVRKDEFIDGVPGRTMAHFADLIFGFLEINFHCVLKPQVYNTEATVAEKAVG